MVTVPLAAGQAVDVTVQHGSGIYRKEAYYPGPGAKHFPIVTVVERMVNITEADNATIFRDLEWSYRRKGETKLTAMLANETARIFVPDKPAETVFEFLLTCTGGVRNGGSKLQAEGGVRLVEGGLGFLDTSLIVEHAARPLIFHHFNHHFSHSNRSEVCETAISLSANRFWFESTIAS